MRKHLLLAGVLLCATNLFAQRSPSHPLDIKDSESNLSTYLEKWLGGTIDRPEGVSEVDDQFYISRVRPLKRIVDGDYQVHSNVDRNRKMCIWVPLDDPTTKWKSLPRYCFEGDNFSMWSYIDIHGNWTSPWIRSTAGLTDVAHKNGVTVGCVLSIPWAARVAIYNGASYGSEYTKILSQLTATDTQGKYKHAAELVKMMKYYGVNAIGVNSEFYTSQSGIEKLIGFFVACHKEAEKIGWEFQVHWYDGTNESGSIRFDAGLGDHNKKMFGDKDNISVDMMFANYNWRDGTLQNSVTKAKELGRNSYDYYAGFDIQGRALRNNYWSALKNNAISIGFWGAHAQSLIHQSATDDGTSDIAIQKAYLLKQELLFSGGNHNPALLPDINTHCTLANASLKNFHGLATFLSAKSTIQSVPFVSRFNLGNGLKFYNEGKVAFDHKWYNLNTQDFMPTWRWWITDKNDQVTQADLANFVKAELTFDEAYWGGSCLRLHGKTAFSRVKLFKTLLKVQPDYELSLVYKLKKGMQTHAKLFVALKGKTNEYKEYMLPNATAEDQWTTAKVKVSELGLGADDEIAMLGIAVENAPEDYDMYVGEMAVRNPSDVFSTTKAPAIKEVKVLRGRYNACDFKIRYASKEEAKGEKTYNDEVGTWYYEIYFKQKGQKEQLLTATTSWAAYVIDAPMVPSLDNRQGQFGVRAVSPDGIHGSEIVWSEMTEVPYDQPNSEVVCDKQVIKPNEDFTLSFMDVLQQPAQEWKILDSQTGAVVASTTGVTKFTTKIDKEGVYDLQFTDSKGTQTTIRGKVVISPLETGAVPEVTGITADKAKADQGEEVKYTYTSKDGTGKVSRALYLKDPNMFMIPAEVQEGKDYSYALWFKAESFSHDKQGTNLINKNTVRDAWPHNNWGDLWVQIRPEWKGDKLHAANEVSFNTMGWTAHDSPNENMMSTGYSITPGVWYHLVVTHNNGNRQTMYLNGKQVAQTVFTDSKRRKDVGQSDPRVQWHEPANIFIGGGGVYKAGFNGWIDEVQVWDHELTQEEVLSSMKGFKENEVPTGLKAYYTFEEKIEDGTFNSLGKAGTQPGKVVAMVSSGGEQTSNASYEPQKGSNEELGYPGITGTLEVITTADWTLEDATLVSKNDHSTIVKYGSQGKKNIGVTLKNRWGEGTKMVSEIVEISDKTTGIGSVDAETGLSVYPNPFVESVNLRFAEGGNYTVNILGSTGTLLQRNNFNVSAGQVVNVAVNGANGVYFVQIVKNGKTYKTIKVIKK